MNEDVCCNVNCNGDVVHVSFIVSFIVMLMEVMGEDLQHSGPCARDWTGENEGGRYGNQGC